MDVLIKGMKMPKGCITCMFKFESLFNRTMWCEWLDDPLGDYSKCDEKWRHPACPLVEVPTPHGRLIDADRTIDKAEMLMKEPSRETVDFMAIGYNHAVADCIAICKGVPTIIEAEEGEQDD